MTKKKSAPAGAIKTVEPAAKPQKGGSYIRDEAGKLTRVAHTKEKEA